MHPFHIRQLEEALNEIMQVNPTLSNKKVSEYLYTLSKDFNGHRPRPSPKDINEFLKTRGFPSIKV